MVGPGVLWERLREYMLDSCQAFHSSQGEDCTDSKASNLSNLSASRFIHSRLLHRGRIQDGHSPAATGTEAAHPQKVALVLLGSTGSRVGASGLDLSLWWDQAPFLTPTGYTMLGQDKPNSCYLNNSRPKTGQISVHIHNVLSLSLFCLV